MRSLTSPKVALQLLLTTTVLFSQHRHSESFTCVSALTEPPQWHAKIDNDWPTGCSPGPFKIATVMPDGKGNVFGSFETCFKIFKQDLSVPGVWTHVAGDGTDPTLANVMTTQSTGTSTPVSPGGPWMGLNNDIMYFSGQGGTNWYYTYSMELTSGNFGVTVMAGNGGSAGGCTDGNVPTVGAMPTSVINSPSFGVYRVTDGYVYQAVQACGTIMKLQTAFPYQTEIEWAGTTLSPSPVSVFGTNDPAAIGGGATKTALRFPVSVTLNSAETEMYVPCASVIAKITVATRITTSLVGANGGSLALTHSDGIGAAAGFGMGVNAAWIRQDETLLFMSFDGNAGTGTLVAVDVTTQELRGLPHNVAPPGATGFVEGPLYTTGQTSVPLFLKDPLSPPTEDRYFVYSQMAGVKGTWSLPTATMTMSETAELATPAPPTPAPGVVTPVPPVPVPPTPAPPAAVATTVPPTPASSSASTSPAPTSSAIISGTPASTATAASPSPTSAATTSVTAIATATTSTTAASTTTSAPNSTTAEVVFEGQGAPAAFQNADGGLNSGEQAGISVGVILAFIAVAGVAGFALWKFKLSKKQKGDLDAKQIDCGAEAEAQGEQKYLSVSPQEKSMFA